MKTEEALGGDLNGEGRGEGPEERGEIYSFLSRLELFVEFYPLRAETCLGRGIEEGEILDGREVKELSQVYVFTHLGAVEASLWVLLLENGKILLVLGLKSCCDSPRCSFADLDVILAGIILQRNGNS